MINDTPSKSLASYLLPTIPFFISIVVIYGWKVGSINLISIIDEKPSMKFATALSILLQSIVTFLICKQGTSGRSEDAILICSSASLASVILGFFGLLGFDYKNNFSSIVGVPSLGTMACFLSFSIISYDYVFGKSTRFFQGIINACAGFVFLVSTVGLMGYLFKYPPLFLSIPHISSGMAVHTCISFLILSLSYFASSAPFKHIGTLKSTKALRSP